MSTKRVTVRGCKIGGQRKGQPLWNFSITSNVHLPKLEPGTVVPAGIKKGRNSLKLSFSVNLHIHFSIFKYYETIFRMSLGCLTWETDRQRLEQTTGIRRTSWHRIQRSSWRECLPVIPPDQSKRQSRIFNLKAPNIKCWTCLNQESDVPHINGLVTEVFDVLWAHVERRFAGHDKRWRPRKKGNISS